MKNQTLNELNFAYKKSQGDSGGPLFYYKVSPKNVLEPFLIGILSVGGETWYFYSDDSWKLKLIFNFSITSSNREKMAHKTVIFKLYDFKDIAVVWFSLNKYKK